MPGNKGGRLSETLGHYPSPSTRTILNRVCLRLCSTEGKTMRALCLVTLSMLIAGCNDPIWCFDDPSPKEVMVVNNKPNRVEPLRRWRPP